MSRSLSDRKETQISVHFVKQNGDDAHFLVFTDLAIPNKAAFEALSKVQVTDGAEDTCHASIIKLVYCHNVHVASHAT